MKQRVRAVCWTGGCECWVERRRLRGDLIVIFQYLKGAYKKAGEGFFTKAWNEFKLKEERFIPDIRKKFFR